MDLIIPDCGCQKREAFLSRSHNSPETRLWLFLTLIYYHHIFWSLQNSSIKLVASYIIFADKRIRVQICSFNKIRDKDNFKYKQLTFVIWPCKKPDKYTRQTENIVANPRHLSNNIYIDEYLPWWRHQMETFSALLALCDGQWCGSLMFSLICALNKRLSKQSHGWWFETS